MSPKYKITAEEKIKLIHAYLSGKITQRYAGEAAGVSHTTIQVWIKRYEAEGADAFYPSRKIVFTLQKQKHKPLLTI